MLHPQLTKTLEQRNRINEGRTRSSSPDSVHSDSLPLASTAIDFCLAIGTKRFNEIFKTIYDRSTKYHRVATAVSIPARGFLGGRYVDVARSPPPRRTVAHGTSNGGIHAFTVTTESTALTEARFFVDDARGARAVMTCLANMSTKVCGSLLSFVLALPPVCNTTQWTQVFNRYCVVFVC